MEPRGSRSKNPWIRWNRIKNWREWTWKGWTLFSVSALLVIVLGYAVYQGVGIYYALDNFEKSNSESRFKDVADKSVEKPPEWEGKERVNILLLGGDARGLQEGQVARSDSMLVVSVDPVTKRAHLLSILRDTYADIPGHSRNRVNTAITLGGPNLAMKTIGELLGIQVHYYVYADFEGFKALVDAIGGVDYEVEKDMKYTDNADKNRYDIDLKKGYQHLDGDKALQYVRFRHDAMSDFTRTERQRNFMKVVVAKMQSTWNIVRMKEILESVQPHIETNLKVSDMLELGQLGLKIQMAGSVQVPPMELIGDERVGGAAVLGIRDEDALRQYVQDVLASTAADPEPTIHVDTPARSNSSSRADDDKPVKTAPPAAEESPPATGGNSSNNGSTAGSGSSDNAGGTQAPAKPTAPATPTTPDDASTETPAGSGNNGGSGSTEGGNQTADPNAPVDPAAPADPQAPVESPDPGAAGNAGVPDGTTTAPDAGATSGNAGSNAGDPGTGTVTNSGSNTGTNTGTGTSSNAGTNGSTGSSDAPAGSSGTSTSPTVPTAPTAPTTPAGNGTQQPAA